MSKVRGRALDFSGSEWDLETLGWCEIRELLSDECKAHLNRLSELRGLQCFGLCCVG